MSKRKTILIAVAVILALIILWGIGYSLLRANDRRIRNKALNNTVSEFIRSDASFAEKYGRVISTSIYEKSQYVSAGNKTVEVPSVVTVEDGTSYVVWVRYDFSGDADIFEYISVTKY